MGAGTLKIAFILLIITGIFTENTGIFVKFTNIKCIDLDINFETINQCKLVAVSRSASAFSVGVHLLKMPVTNVSVRFRFMRKSNGYLPFLFDFTLDACKFLKDSAKNRKHPIVNYLYNMARKYSNLNHTCPYDHDVILDRFIFDNADANFDRTFLAGDYGIYSTWYAYNIARADFKLFFTVF